VGYVTKKYVQNFVCQHHGKRPFGKTVYVWAESVDWYLLDKKRAKDGALSQGNKLAGSKRRGIEYVSDYLVPVTLS